MPPCPPQQSRNRVTQLPTPELGEMELTWQEIMSITELQVSRAGGTWGRKEQKSREYGWDGGRVLEQAGNVPGTGKGKTGVGGRAGGKTRILRGKGCGRGGGDLIGGVSSLGSHSAHISPSHLLPRLPFLTFFPSELPLLQSCPSSSLVSSPCPQMPGPFPSGSRAVGQGPGEGVGGVRL